MLKRLMILAPLLGLSCGGRFLCQMPDSGATTPLALDSHVVHLDLDPDDHSLSLVDSIRFQGTLNRFELNSALKLKSLRINGRKVPSRHLTISEPVDPLPGSRTAYLLTCQSPDAGLVVIEASGEMWQDPASMRFGHQTVGNELQATIGQEGFWFAPEAAILPWFASQTHPAWRVHAELPAEWSFVTQGSLIEDRLDGDRRFMGWQGEIRAEAVSLMGGPYEITREEVEGVELSTWFLRRDPAEGPFMGHAGPVDDEQVRTTLLSMSGEYLRMYNQLLGPYPFSKFAVVESFFPAGYGMPSWTLLGSHVIRMPYIPYTSLGHELLHNYWGNGVLVDNSEGNWCEGITVFDADYLYKLEKGPEAAKDYRKTVLKDYRSYVHGGSKDLALSEFRNRHDGATRSIGYGKSMMVYHMLDQLLGTESFLKVRRRLFAEYHGKEANWTDIFRLAEEEGRVDLKRFRRQWIGQTGAPSLEIGSVDWEDGTLTLVISQNQGGIPYELDVPVRVECHDGSVIEERVYMDEASVEVEVACSEVRKVLVDPDFDIFRLLDGREVEPVISMVLAEEQPLFVAPAEWLRTPAKRAALDAFASGLTEIERPEWVSAGRFNPDVLAGRSVIGVNLESLPEGIDHIDLRLGSEWQLAGERGSRTESNLVLAARSSSNDTKGALLFWVSSENCLPYMARKVPHYGKYSYLAFDNDGTNLWKGNLQPAGNPLERRFGSW